MQCERDWGLIASNALRSLVFGVWSLAFGVCFLFKPKTEGLRPKTNIHD